MALGTRPLPGSDTARSNRARSGDEVDRSRPTREPRSLRYHEVSGARRQPAGKVLQVGGLALLLAAVLNADSLYSLANRQPVGWKRDVARAAVAPFRGVAGLTRLDRPREALVRAAGRDPSVGTGDNTLVAPSTTVPIDPQEPPFTLRKPTASAPLRVWLGGDSMTIELSQSVEDAVTSRPTFRVTTDPRVSSGLARFDYFNWPEHLVDAVLPDEPEVVVIMFGANDSQDLELESGVFQPEDPEWQAEYRRRVEATMDLVRGDGRLTVWVGQPHMRDSGFDARMGVLNGIYEEEASARPWIRFLDSRTVLSPAGDGYQAADGDTSLRQGDGVHLDRPGADRLAAAILDLIDEEITEAADAPR